MELTFSFAGTCVMNYINLEWEQDMEHEYGHSILKSHPVYPVNLQIGQIMHLACFFFVLTLLDQTFTSKLRQRLRHKASAYFQRTATLKFRWLYKNVTAILTAQYLVHRLLSMTLSEMLSKLEIKQNKHI